MVAIRKTPPHRTGPVTLADVEAAFSQHWDGRAFKPFQSQVVGSALEGKDTLGVFPVGSGKSAVFQAPSIVMPGTVLVISPLIALMKDQVDGSRKRGIAADCINSNMDEREVEATMARCVSGATKLLYVAPERLFSPAFNRVLRQLTVPLLACDEAHSCSRASSYRPAYLRIKNVVNQLPRRPTIVALTATMTAHIEAEVIQALGMKPDYARFIGSPVRDNLDYVNVWATKNEWSEFARVFERLTGEGRHIVYVNSRKGAEIACDKLCDKTGMDSRLVGYYHAGMRPDERRNLQDAFVSGSVRTIFATVAFGMGIDIPDIRTVVNLGIPGSMEDVVQMGGRAGRDGKRSLCYCIGSDYSRGTQERFINSEHPEWSTFQDVHAWLRANLQPDETMYLSAEAIVKRIGESKMKHGSYDAAAVGSVLHRFEAYGAVVRRPMSSASDITITPALMKATLSPNLDRLRQGLVTLLGRPGNAPITGMLEAPAIAAASGVPSHLITAGLLKLTAENLIRKLPSYNGKSCAWNPGEYDKDLEELVSQSEIEDRRRRELERLQHVVDYVNARDPAAFICDYFAQPS